MGCRLFEGVRGGNGDVWGWDGSEFWGTDGTVGLGFDVR